jgi:mRNA-degrading endonuclease YafQ of YafQ-DinJ toxin-antitoxin module
MKIQYSDTFSKAFKVLSFAEKEAVLETIRLFQEHPLDPSLHNHPLSKPMIGQRAISAGDDLRIIFREK